MHNFFLLPFPIYLDSEAVRERLLSQDSNDVGSGKAKDIFCMLWKVFVMWKSSHEIEQQEKKNYSTKEDIPAKG